MHTNTHKHTFPVNRASVMALGKNLPQSAQSDSFYYLLITFLLQAGEFSNLLRPAGRRVEEVVFPALRDKRPSQVSENVQQFCILTRIPFLLLYLYIKWTKGSCVYIIYNITYCVLKLNPLNFMNLYLVAISVSHSHSLMHNTSHSMHKLMNCLSFTDFTIKAYKLRV